MPNSHMCLDELLYGNPDWEQIVAFFKTGDFHEEQYLVEAIEQHLLTEDQRKLIFDSKLSIEKMLNGRTTSQHSLVTQQVYNEWNTKLGFKYFGT